MAQPYSNPSFSTASSWFSVGPASSFLNITGTNSVALAEVPACNTDSCQKPPIGCRVFLPPTAGSESAIEISHDPQDQLDASLKDGNQVLVFKYNGRFHAIDNKCPHSSYPLSDATPFDIEDFGIILSAGITCPKHGWSFDLFTGTSDRGNYKLKIWDVRLTPFAKGDGEEEVWVKRRARIG